MKSNFSRRAFFAALAVGALSAVGTVKPALAHEANCPLCAMPVVQDTATTDNEVALKFGRKRIEYRCVFCALSEAQTDYKNGDVTIYAPSEKKGEPIAIKRVGGKWSAPEGTLFAAQKATHKVCPITYRAFASQAGFAAWVKAHPEQFGKDAKPQTLEAMLELSKTAVKSP